jgi:hypothetical protein
VLGHGVSHQTLAMLVLAGLAKAVTETLRPAQGKIGRMLITDAGKRRSKVDTAGLATSGSRLLSAQERPCCGRRWLGAWGVTMRPPHAAPALDSEELRQGPGLCRPD